MQLDGQKAFLTGKLKTKGNMMFATKLDGVLKVCRHPFIARSSRLTLPQGYEDESQVVEYCRNLDIHIIHTSRIQD